MAQSERAAGYVQALDEAGLVAEEARAASTLEGGRAAAERLLARADRPTAIFATNDALAAGVVGAIQALGLRCPWDLSVVGYDSHPWQEVFAPRLTTVRQPAYAMGRRAAELLLARLSWGKEGLPRRVVFRPTLIVRESTACVPE